jgi:hypothetical protein
MHYRCGFLVDSPNEKPLPPEKLLLLVLAPVVLPPAPKMSSGNGFAMVARDVCGGIENNFIHFKSD